MPAAHFLQRSRHGTTFFFRRRVPDDLHAVLGHKQLYRSLGTSCRVTAVKRARALAVKADKLFGQLRMSKNPIRPIQADWTISLNLPGKGKVEFTGHPDDSDRDRQDTLAAIEFATKAAQEVAHECRISRTSFPGNHLPRTAFETFRGACH